MLSSAVVHAADSGAADAPQAQPGVLLDTIRASRKALVAVNLGLSPAEADKAMQLMESYLAAEAERVQVHRSYLGEFTKIRPGRTVARFYQIENKMEAVLRYDLAATIPIADEKRGTPAGEVRGSLPSFRAIIGAKLPTDVGIGASERSRIGLDV